MALIAEFVASNAEFVSVLSGGSEQWGREVWACGLALTKVKTHFLPSPITCAVFVTETSSASGASSLALRDLLTLERKKSRWNASYLCYLRPSPITSLNVLEPQGWAIYFAIQNPHYPFIFPLKTVAEYAERYNHQTPRVTFCFRSFISRSFLDGYGGFFQSLCFCNILIYLWLAQ